MYKLTGSLNTSCQRQCQYVPTDTPPNISARLVRKVLSKVSFAKVSLIMASIHLEKGFVVRLLTQFFSEETEMIDSKCLNASPRITSCTMKKFM